MHAIDRNCTQLHAYQRTSMPVCVQALALLTGGLFTLIALAAATQVEYRRKFRDKFMHEGG